MTHEEKINYLRLSCNICRLNLSNQQVDLLISLYEATTTNKGSLNLNDIVNIEITVDKRHNNRPDFLK